MDGARAKEYRLNALRNQLRREGSLAAALIQSMALAVIGTAGAYPSWVLVKGEKDVVLGAAWAVTRIDPVPDSPLLGDAGGPVMFAIAYCCLLSVASGSLALMLDFLGRRQGRSWAPLLHGVTAVLIASSSACGSCLLALVRGRARTDPELVPLNYSINPGQSLFLSFLACILAATATGLSCSSPARVQPARSSWDLGRPARRTHHTEAEARPPPGETVIWQEAMLPSFLLDLPPVEEDETTRQRWYDYVSQDPDVYGSQQSFLRSVLHSSSHGGLGSLHESSSRERYWDMGSAQSVGSPTPPRAPPPSKAECELPPDDTEGRPFPGRELEIELHSPRRARSLTWNEAAAREGNSGV